MEEKSIISKRCAVSFQNRKNPMYAIPLEGGTPKGVEWVSWPFGRVIFYENYLTIKAVRELKINYSEIDCIKLSKHWLSAYIEIIHADSTIPKIIWLKMLFITKAFFKKLNSKLNGKIKFQS